MRMTKEKTSTGRLDTYIGEQTSFEGTLTSKENLSIYGNVKGKIECQGRVVIGESGRVEADILANDVIVSGKIVGNVTAKGKLEMSSTGIIQGDIKTSRLIMEDGGKFDGRSEMMLDGKPVNVKAEDVPQALPAKETPKLPKASRK